MAKTKKTPRKSQTKGKTQSILEAEASRLRAQIKKLEEDLMKADNPTEPVTKPSSPPNTVTHHDEPSTSTGQSSSRGHKDNNSEYKCTQCKATFTYYNSLKRHTEREHDEFVTVYQCDTCFNDFNRIDALKRHFNLKHNIQVVKKEFYSVFKKPNNPKDLSTTPPV